VEYEALLYDVTDRIATITLNRPDRLNALNTPMRHEMYDAISQSENRDDVRAIVITGAGRGFCSGGDVKVMDEANRKEPTTDSSPSALTEKVAPIRDRVVLAMRDATKPVIAAVNGPAAGAGMNIALAADIRIASTTARFGQTFSRRGLHPDWGGTYFLPRVVGMAKACELIWSGRMIDADEALALGIVSQLTDPDDLMSATYELAGSFAAGPPTVIRLAKRAMYRSMESGLREALEFETYAQNICSSTADAKEGIRAFVEKREPKFTGR
jgi:2-(1,2-epoxy-1,2-dihydrophenyl)acetyl-CoA isomerase|tara:strand:+ start:578 stop:1387 length:810 start_codon:yes stop_codon:yes gene_type:complete